MNKRNSTSKEITRAPAKRLSQKVLRAADKDLPMQSSRGVRSTASTGRKTAVPKKNSSLSKPDGECSDSSLESSDYYKQTTEIKQKILNSMKNFKAASEELCGASSQFNEEFKRFHSDFASMKNEVKNVLDESNKSKLEILKIRGIRNDSPYRGNNISTKNSPGNVSDVLEDYFENPQEKILCLRKELDELKMNFSKNEDELRVNDSQNEELRAAAFKMQDTFEDQSENEDYTKISACRSCIVM
jgi:hypothetical protein